MTGVRQRLAPFLLLIVLRLYGQEGAAVNPVGGAQPSAVQVLNYYSGTNLQYSCLAASRSRQTTITVSAASNANPVSITATAHNLGDFATLGATITPIVQITGYTSNWSALNGVWAVTITSANAFTVPVDSTTFGAVTGTPVYTTLNPRLNDNVWSITKLFYDGSSNLITQAWAGNPGGAASKNLVPTSSGASFACSSRSTYAYQ